MTLAIFTFEVYLLQVMKVMTKTGDNENTTLLIGIASAAYPLGPVFGFGLAAGFLRLPENLKGFSQSSSW